MELSKHLARLRKQGRRTQKSVADFLTKHGPKSYTFKTVSQWETGVSEPSVEAFLLLCELYGVSDIRREFGVSAGVSTAAAAADINALNALGRERLAEYTRLLARDPRFREAAVTRVVSIEEAKKAYTVRLYELSASAGTGIFLDGEDYEDYETTDETAQYADFAIRIAGDSMNPKFDNGQVVFVEQTQSLREGEIGIFSLNGEGYCKELGDGCLISLNDKYDPIELGEYDALFVLGRVLG